MVHLQKMHQKFGQKVGFVSIYLDNRDKAKASADELKLTYTVLTDPRGKAAAVPYGIRGIPATFIIDQKGVVRDARVGCGETFERDVTGVIDGLLKK